MKPKLFLALLILSVCLFMCGTVSGVNQGGAQITDLSPSLVNALGGLLVRPRPLRAEDITAVSPAGCQQLFQQNALVLPTSVTCTFDIGTSSTSLRTLPLRLNRGVTAVAQLTPAGGRGVTARHDLNVASPEARLQVFTEGASLTVSCVNGGQLRTCLLETNE